MDKRVLIFLAIMAICLSGCTNWVESYTTFSVVEFDEFNEIISNVERESYIAEGKLDFAKIGDVFIVPFIKETNHSECTLFVYAYSFNNADQVLVNSASISTHGGIALCNVESAEQQIEVTSVTEKMLSGVAIVDTFEKTGEWFYSGNQLYLSFRVDVTNGENTISKELNYKVTLVGHKTLLFPT